MTDFVVIIILIGILGGAIAYMVKAKKKGTKCIGCPHAGGCYEYTGKCVCAESDDAV